MTHIYTTSEAAMAGGTLIAKLLAGKKWQGWNPTPVNVDTGGYSWYLRRNSHGFVLELRPHLGRSLYQGVIRCSGGTGRRAGSIFVQSNFLQSPRSALNRAVEDAQHMVNDLSCDLAYVRFDRQKEAIS